MRDLVFKNLVCGEKKRRIISSSEIVDNQGMRSIVRRHFVYMVREVDKEHAVKPLPYLYILKKRSNKEQNEKFFCRIKGSVYAINAGRTLLVTFMHSLKITLINFPGLVKMS